MSLFAKVFSTRTLVPIACVLGGVFFMKGLGAYYDFKWATALAAQLGNSPGWLSVIKIATRARTKRLPPVAPVFVSHFTNSDGPGEINLICPSDNLNCLYKFWAKAIRFVAGWVSVKQISARTDNLTPYPENGPDQSEARSAPGYIRPNGIRLER